MKRTPMKRGQGFKRPTLERTRTVHQPIPEHLRRGRISHVGQAVAAVTKDVSVRSEAYRRLVAALPCICCGFHGHSQAAHPNTGKGAGTKTDDRLCFPLCTETPGRQGCHSKFDAGALFTKQERRQIESEWSAATRQAIERSGLWPKGLEQICGDQCD